MRPKRNFDVRNERNLLKDTQYVESFPLASAAVYERKWIGEGAISMWTTAVIQKKTTRIARSRTYKLDRGR